MTAMVSDASVTRVVSYGETTGSPADAMMARVSQPSVNLAGPNGWGEAIDEMESWRSGHSLEDTDRPDPAILVSATHFANEYMWKEPPPTLVMPSGCGRIALEWQTPDETLVLEFRSPSDVLVLHYEGARLVAREFYRWETLSRKLVTAD